MFKQHKFKIVMLLGIIMMLLLYHFGTRTFNVMVRSLYFELVTKKLVKNKTVLTESEYFSLGLYRPEIPYDFTSLFEIEDSLKVNISIVSFYQAWGDGDEHAFPLEICRNLDKGGYVPLITWEPWIVAFNGFTDSKPDSSLRYIINGRFDYYIREWARNAVRFGKPLYVRPGHEMTNGWYSWSSAHKNSPEMFRQFWIHVHTIFTEEKADNVAFVWNPYTSADTLFYPGNDYVDWVGLDIFNYGTYSVEGIWMDFYNVTKIFYDQVKMYNKPILIAETGTVGAGGNKAVWFRDMFHYLAVDNFPLIKGLVLFDTPNSKTPTGIPVDLSMSSDSTVYSLIKQNRSLDSLNIKKNK
jgi:hypothetical protein